LKRLKKSLFWCDKRSISEIRREASIERVSRTMIRSAKYRIGEVVKHRIFPFRGIVFDVDPEFDNTDEWYEAIPEDIRPAKDQPYYHLLAENDDTEYVAYVSEQNLLLDDDGNPLRHPQISEWFRRDDEGHYVARETMKH